MEEKKTDDRLKQLLKSVEEDLPQADVDAGQIERLINRRISAIAVRVVLIVLACIVGLLLVVSPLVQMFFYNPASRQGRQAASTAEGTNVSELTLCLDTYTSVFMPYVEVCDTEVKTRGFGCFTVTLDIIDHKSIIISELNKQAVYDVNWGNWSAREGGLLMSQFPGRFDEYDYNPLEKAVADIEELPDSCVVCCSLVLEAAVTPEQLRRDGIEIDWICVEQSVNQAAAGISLFRRRGLTDSEKWRDAMSGAELKDEFLAELDILINDPEFLDSWGVAFSDGKGGVGLYGNGTVRLQQIRDTVATQSTLYTSKICVIGKKQDILNYIDDMGAIRVHVDDVRLSQWSQ